MTLPLTAEFTIKSVRTAGQKPNPHGGTFDKYYVDLLDPEGNPVRDAKGKTDGAYWQRKTPSEVNEGEVVYGTVSEGDYGLRFKAEKRPDAGGSTSSSGGGSYRGGGGGKSPDQQASIVRQHSQEMAICVLAAIGSPPELDTGALKTNLKDWTDFFAADAGAAQAANGTGGGSSPQPSVPPQASDTQGIHELLTELFVKAGEAGPIATLLTGWVIETQAVEKQDKALAALREPESAAVVVKWAREGYEAKHGPLPGVSTDIDDGIPFARPEYGEVFSERERHSNRP
jgi:hypothetical protein